MKAQGLRRMVIAVTVTAALAGVGMRAQALSTAFTYQGQIVQNGTPANGWCDLRFDLFGVATGGSSIGTQTKNNVSVNNGLFTVELDFPVSDVGSPFDGNDRWLEMAVACPAGGGTFETLTPREQVTATPYAFYAPQAGHLTCSHCIGTDQIIDTAVTSEKIAPGAVTSENIAPGAVTSPKIAVPLKVTNPSGNAIEGHATGGIGTGLIGTSASEFGVGGVAHSAPSHLPPDAPASAGVMGMSSTTVGVEGISEGDAGVFGESTKTGGNGVVGIANSGGTAAGVVGKSSTGSGGMFSNIGAPDGTPALLALSASSSTVAGASAILGTGLLGSNGVEGRQSVGGSSLVSPNVAGLLGNAHTGIGVVGLSDHDIGVYGRSTDQCGVGGYASQCGVMGTASDGTGVVGQSDTGHGGYFSNGGRGTMPALEGWSGTNRGVRGTGPTFGVEGVSGSVSSFNYSLTAGVFGHSHAALGVIGLSDSSGAAYFENGAAVPPDTFPAVEAHSEKNAALWGRSTNRAGVWGQAGDASNLSDQYRAAGVVGSSQWYYGVVGISDVNEGVLGQSLSTYGTSGVHGIADYSNASGVLGQSIAGNGVSGTTLDGTGVQGTATGSGWAGFFDGRVGVGGNLLVDYDIVSSGNIGAGNDVSANRDVSAGANIWAGNDVNAGAAVFSDTVHTGILYAWIKNFRIDHPLDPANKYLVHASVEGPQAMNLYTGNVTTDENGDATITLPSYFSALNIDFRYQLTVIGQFAQAIVAREIEDNQFAIKTDKPAVKVSWQVVGTRNDAAMRAYPFQAEQDKPEGERGHYLQPELFGASADKKIGAPKTPAH